MPHNKNGWPGRQSTRPASAWPCVHNCRGRWQHARSCSDVTNRQHSQGEQRLQVPFARHVLQTIACSLPLHVGCSCTFVYTVYSRQSTVYCTPFIHVYHLSSLGPRDWLPGTAGFQKAASGWTRTHTQIMTGGVCYNEVSHVPEPTLGHYTCCNLSPTVSQVIAAVRRAHLCELLHMLGSG